MAGTRRREGAGFDMVGDLGRWWRDAEVLLL